MITRNLFDRIFPTRGLTSAKFLRKYNLVRERDALIAALNKFLPLYKINTYLRISAFLGNCGIETDYFKTTIEYATGDAYEGRRNLGNTQRGDGRRFKGRGLSQTTGRYNYEAVQKAIGAALGIDVIRNPELLAEIEIAVESACIFWRDHNLNKYADRGEFKQLSGIVNKGSAKATPLHWFKRKSLYDKCLQLIPENLGFETKPADAAINQQPAAMNPSVGANLAPVIENSPEDLAVPQIPVSTTSAPANSDQTPDGGAPDGKSKIKELGEKYLKHCPKDKLTNILQVIVARIAGVLTPIWSAGLHGKILLILAALVSIGFIAYALYYYSPRIFNWTRDIADSLIGSEENNGTT